jgi:hypothetical protein
MEKKSEVVITFKTWILEYLGHKMWNFTKHKLFKPGKHGSRT